MVVAAVDVGDEQKRCSMREKYKLDFDAYFRSVQSLREKTNPNPSKLARKEAKLAAAEELLDNYSEELFQGMRALQEDRDVFLMPRLKQVGPFLVLPFRRHPATACACA
jgi:hypothetical protein